MVAECQKQLPGKATVGEVAVTLQNQLADNRLTARS